MAGETIKTQALCLSVHPWSKTSHIVSWLTPVGKVTTIVKGAQRPKSAFLGQYDLNYTCEILYYARAKGDMHALRECAPVEMREYLRGDVRSLVLSSYFRSLCENLSPQGPDCEQWLDCLSLSLDNLASSDAHPIAKLLDFELDILKLMGLWSGISPEGGSFELRGERKMPVSAETARCLKSPLSEKNLEVLLDAARVIGVFYAFHVDVSAEARRSVLSIIAKTIQKRRSAK